MSQKDLAEASGLTQGTISRLESGTVLQLKSDPLAHVARALLMPIDELVGAKVAGLAATIGVAMPSIVDPSDSVFLRLLNAFGRLDDSRRKQLLEYAQFLSKLDK